MNGPDGPTEGTSTARATASCPRCGLADPGPVECPRCGVVFAKMAARVETGRSQHTAPHAPVWHDAEAGSRRRLTRTDVVLGLLLLAAGAWLVRSRMSASPAPAAPRPSETASQAGGQSTPRVRAARREEASAPAPEFTFGAADAPAPAFSPAPLIAPPPGYPAEVAALPEADRETWKALARVAEGQAEVQSDDTYKAEQLFQRYRNVAWVGRVAKAVFERAAEAEVRRGRPDEALRNLERIVELWPESQEAWSAIINAHMESRRWRDAEAFARRALSYAPASGWLYDRLARSLMMQDRHEEAADVLRRALAQGGNPELRGLLYEIEQGLSHERGLARIQSAHFTIHVQGEASSFQGRDLLAVLERKYDELARTLNFEPQTEIAVLLYPDQRALTDSGAPRWAAASFSHADGRIRVGSADLQGGITAVVEETLTHELVHAFVAARVGGNCPRDINEGLAQYLSGNRSRPITINTDAIGTGGRVSVREFYEAALSFVDFLIGRYGQASMNDLLAALAEVDRGAAFRRAYRLDYDQLKQEWIKQLP